MTTITEQKLTMDELYEITGEVLDCKTINQVNRTQVLNTITQTEMVNFGGENL